MTNLNFQNTFKSYFHDKYSFDDFLCVNTSEEVKIFTIQKTDIYSPSYNLKQFQQFLNIFIFDKLLVNDEVCHSYQKGKNIHSCLVPHKDSQYYFTADIRNFFSSIKRSDAEKILEQNINNVSIIDLKKYIVDILDIVTMDGNLPVGFLTSPKISNAFLYEFDNVVQNYCKDKSIVYTRYSDDLIFSSSDQGELHEMQTYLTCQLEQSFGEKILLNSKKTKILSKSSKVKLLSIVLTTDGTLTIDKKIKSDIEILFHFYLTNKTKFNDVLKNRFDNRIGRVFGIMSYINGIDRHYILFLRKKYGNYIVDGFLHRSIYE